MEKIDFIKIERIVEEYADQIDLSICIPAEEFMSRQEKVKTVLKEREFDVGLFFWYREMPEMEFI